MRVFCCVIAFMVVAGNFAVHAEDRAIKILSKGSAPERRLALVIGNRSYPDAPLKNPVNDADAMVAALTETGFTVIVRKNADRREMFSAIREFGQKLKKSDIGLFYYAGHGIQVEGANYLLPVDLRGSDLQDAEDLRHEAIPLAELLERMRDAGTNNILILDACRDNPFLAKVSRSSSRGLAKVITPASTSVLYSTDPGNTASDGSGNNGTFTRRLTESMLKSGLELVDVMREVSVAVNADTGGAQHPVFDGVLSAKFYFRPAEYRAEPPLTPSVDPKMVEVRYWESVDKTNTPSGYRAYLKKYPDGEFTDLAHEKIKLLESIQALSEEARKAEAERKAREVAEKELQAKERAEQEGRIRELEAKVVQAEKLAKQIEEKTAKVFLERAAAVADPNAATPSAGERKTTPGATPVPNLVYTDPAAGLMWVTDGNLAEKPMSLDQAQGWVRRLDYGGYRDWRLPTVGELSTLAKRGGTRPSQYFNSHGFKNVQESAYLSATEGKNMHWVQELNMVDGSKGEEGQWSEYYVWPVRSTR